MRVQWTQVVVMVIGLSLASLAQGGDGPATNQEIIVRASRMDKGVSSIPANITILTDEAIRSAGHASLVEALQKQAGIQVRSTTGNPANSEVSLRGFGENAHGRVLVLLDGRRLNRPDMAGINWLQVPLSNVSRVEVIRGAASSLYGDNAVAGVINIVTRQGDGDERGFVSSEAGSDGMLIGRAGVNMEAGPVAASLNGERYELDGYRDRAAFLSWGGGANMRFTGAGGLTASLALSGQQVEFEMPGYLSREQMQEDRRQAVNKADEAEDRYFNADLGVGWASGRRHNLESHAVWGRKDMSSDMASWFSYSDLAMDTYGLMPRYSCHMPVAGLDNMFVAGLDVYRDTLAVERYGDQERTIKAMQVDVTRDTAAVYLRDDLSLTRQWVAGLGGRLENARINADVRSADGATDFDGSKDYSESAMDASISYRRASGSRAFARVATVYRFPFVDEQVSYYGFGTDQFYDDVNPETGWNLDVGVRVEHAKQFSAGLTVFRLELDDEIAYNNGTFRNENLDATRHQGLEADVSTRVLPFCRLRGSYTFTDATFTAGPRDGKDIPLVPHHRAMAGAEFTLPFGVSLDVSANHVGSMYLGGDNANTADRLGAYTTADALVRYIGAGRLSGFEAHIGVDNLFNRKYVDLGYLSWTGDGAYYPSPERTVKGGVAYRF
jgi:iron complex outermembrane receptor protein